MRLGSRWATAVAVAAGSAAGLLALTASIDRLVTDGLQTLDEVVAAGVQALGALVLLWYLLTSIGAMALLLLRAGRRAWTRGERCLGRLGAPLARRLLLSGTGALVAGAAVLAPATAAAPPAPDVGVADDLGWGADGDDGSPEGTDAPTRTAQPTAVSPPGGEGSEPEPNPPDPTEAAPASTSESDEAEESGSPTYTVVDGDSLWAIAADHLPEYADDADIAAAWPAWFAENRDVVGADPDLIHPGQVLLVPDHDPKENA